MAYLIGVDEAGYGPNLGPLVIGGTLWRIEDPQGDLAAVDLYQRLQNVVGTKPSPQRLAIADSKVIYAKRKDLSLLEEAVLATCDRAKSVLPIWQGACEVDFADEAVGDHAPWYQGWESPFPLHTTSEIVTRRRDGFSACCDEEGITLADVQSMFLTAKRFNARLVACDNKSTVLSQATMGLVCHLLQTIPTDQSQAIRIVCDKHGGRDYYLGLLQHFFPDVWWQPWEESKAVSRYAAEVGPHQVTIEFRSKGEGFLPTALASIYAKFHREVAMLAFNRYWATHVPGIAETAGYPVDAKRFAQETEAARKKLGIAWETFWRLK
ncbi:hypothetical protein C5Y97_15060 [Blastopirellula marina]|uniref:Uncharacterized protein n=1 Tax=Blastopirellula marina TaxID=124 RepID=A0A2S8FN49_9BACT|nr:hypothetical protein C5Y98_15050 [Blastopirellula marina]PTL43344.1 hypothetical protein C5Y97_15060 [Blastopirellula marina]